MSTLRDNSAASPQPTGPAQGAGLSYKDPQAKLAHELANLLDGSLRNVGLVMSSLRDTPAPGSSPTTPPARETKAPEDDDLFRRLESANQAMQHMAAILHRWMSRAGSRSHVHHDQRTLGEIVDSAVRLLSPIAAAKRIELRSTLAPEAAALPAGPMYAVIANAVRNSIEALMQQNNIESGFVAIDLTLVGGDVELVILDNGPGVSGELFDAHGGLLHGVTTKEGGHGIGLSVAREIIEDLEGTVELTNVQPRGARFVARYPAVSVTEHA